MIKKIHIVFLIIFAGCVADKRITDKPSMDYVRKHAAEMEEAAAFAIMFSRENKEGRFLVSEIKDREKRKLVSKFGSSFNVIFKNYGELDSVVIFSSLSIRFGSIEYYYDFATRPQNFSDDTTNSQDYMFRKITDRIYYNRRPFPLM